MLPSIESTEKTVPSFTDSLQIHIKFGFIHRYGFTVLADPDLLCRASFFIAVGVTSKWIHQ